MEDKKPFVNCKKTKLWKMTNEQTGTYSSTVTIDLEDRLTTYTDNVSVNSTPLYGDGKMQDNAVAEGAGTLQLGVHHIRKQTSSSKSIILKKSSGRSGMPQPRPRIRSWRRIRSTSTTRPTKRYRRMPTRG